MSQNSARNDGILSLLKQKYTAIKTGANDNTPQNTVALLGNPNVGKSSLFNRLTGLSRHTGNWSGKTVDSAVGKCRMSDYDLFFADLPGTYSLMPKSAEEEVSGDFLIFENPRTTVVVADATCLARTSILLFETLEITKNTVLCVNLMDEAKKQDIEIDINLLSEKLKIPVVGISARKKSGIDELMKILKNTKTYEDATLPEYTKPIEDAIATVSPYLTNNINLPARWLALRLLSEDYSLFRRIHKQKGIDLLDNDDLNSALNSATETLKKQGIDAEKLRDTISACRVIFADDVISACVTKNGAIYREFDRKIDRILTGKGTSTLVMLLLLAVIFWITLSGANKVSGILSSTFSWLEAEIRAFLTGHSVPAYITSPLCDGVLHILFKVISVMLPPMAIFFPLFTLLEDSGYLPRVAFNLDRHFKKCSSCGKQAYSMCMGFGCNAAGVTGARIIDSKRERTLAILTNCLVPCNGKFPALTSIITMFLIFNSSMGAKTVLGAALLTLLVIISVLMTFWVTNLLSKTLLRGAPSSFTLELPPYRTPELGKIIVRSFLDRGIFVISRAAAVAAPCGLLIWCMANITISGETLLSHTARFLEPAGRLMGLDGTILLAFILGFPANEIIIPLIITGYSSLSTIAADGGLFEIRTLFLENGWTIVTAINVIVFMLFHWPCSTTLLTIKKETKSIKLTLLAFIIPTLIGFLSCVLINLISKLFI